MEMDVCVAKRRTSRNVCQLPIKKLLKFDNIISDLVKSSNLVEDSVAPSLIMHMYYVDFLRVLS